MTKLGTPGQSQTPLSPATAKYLADLWKATGGYLPAGIARSSKAIEQIMNAANVTDMTPGQFVANAAGRSANEAALKRLQVMTDQATTFGRQAIANLNIAEKLAPTAIPTDWGPAINNFILTGETQAGNVTAPAYLSAVLVAANEYAKVISGSIGAAASTDSSRREAMAMLNPYLSSGQFAEVGNVLTTEMQKAIDSRYQQIGEIYGRLRHPGTEPTPPSLTGGTPPGGAAPPGGDTGDLPPDLPPPPGGGASGAGPQTYTPQNPAPGSLPYAQAVPKLKQNPTPEARRQFDARYGQGAAAQALGQ